MRGKKFRRGHVSAGTRRATSAVGVASGYGGLITRQVPGVVKDIRRQSGRQYRYPPKSDWIKHFHANGLLRMRAVTPR